MAELYEKRLNSIEAAKLLGIPVAVFRNLMQRGDIDIKSEIVNGVTKYPYKELVRWNLAKKHGQLRNS